MGTVVFENPNEPEQPTEGVYLWSYVIPGRERKVPFYIGEVGRRQHGLARRPSTLERGASEMVRPSLSANGGRTLTTRFIVGTAIMYLTQRKGLDCVWEHIDPDPHTENNLCGEHHPILQDGNARIRREFKLTRPDGTPWNSRNLQHVREAEERLYRLFDRVFRV